MGGERHDSDLPRSPVTLTASEGRLILAPHRSVETDPPGPRACRGQLPPNP